eukprot:GHRR01024661.1.p2 GENE.GHRR01024661.1~~GHRR01024661.1.p2  ORF type:complete len:122 (-),score=23.20 GHRR01024661.1:344-709(-)
MYLRPLQCSPMLVWASCKADACFSLLDLLHTALSGCAYLHMQLNSKRISKAVTQPALLYGLTCPVCSSDCSGPRATAQALVTLAPNTLTSHSCNVFVNASVAGWASCRNPMPSPVNSSMAV